MGKSDGHRAEFQKIQQVHGSDLTVPARITKFVRLYGAADIDVDGYNDPIPLTLAKFIEVLGLDSKSPEEQEVMYNKYFENFPHFTNESVGVFRDLIQKFKENPLADNIPEVRAFKNGRERTLMDRPGTASMLPLTELLSSMHLFSQGAIPDLVQRPGPGGYGGALPHDHGVLPPNFRGR